MGILDFLKSDKRPDYTEFMTDAEIEEAKKIISLCNDAFENTKEKLADISKYEDAYNGEQQDEEDRPNTRINLIHPNVEGQVADISTKTIGLTFKGQEEMDDKFAEEAKIQSEWTLEHQNSELRIRSTFARRFIKFGPAFLKMSYNPYAFDGFGLSVIETPSCDRVFIDTKITNASDLQNSEYIFEYIDSSRDFAERVYGKDKADMISYGETDERFDLIFKTDDYENDNETFFMLVQCWTKTDGNLRCREYTSTGFLLWDSAKGEDRKENQRDKKPDFSKPLYTNVYNKYPYIIKNCYEREGELYGYGDVKLIADIQDMINTQWDNIRMATRAPRTLIDARSDIAPEDLDEDVFTPLIYEGGNLGGSPPFTIMESGKPSGEWWNMINSLMYNIQRITRYSELMTGQSTGAGKTATESAILQQQGGKSTSMKLLIVSEALKEALLYCLGLDLQYKSGEKFLRIGGDSSQYAKINYDALKNVPSYVPMESGEREEWKKRNYRQRLIPEKQLAMEKGKLKTHSIALDLKVSIGSKTPVNPATLGQLMTQFASFQLVSKEGVQRPAIFWEEFRKMLLDVYDLPIESVNSIEESMKAIEAQRERERQQMLAIQQSQAAQKAEAQNTASTRPGGTPANITQPNNRSDLGVMQGVSDFKSATGK